MESTPAANTKIQYHIVAAVLGPIISGSYDIGKAVICVSYPTFVVIPSKGPVPLPNGMSTMFKVEWDDHTGDDLKKLQSKDSSRLEPFYFALSQINELLLAYKLVRIGHLNGSEVRTIGEADCLLRAPFVDGVHTGELNLNLRTHLGTNRWGFANPQHPEDPLGTTALAIPHIGKPTLLVGRRFARCFDLIEHGYYTEALVVSFAILDDQVQIALDRLLESKGLGKAAERKQLIRNIKEQRLKSFLGPVLKLLHSKSISDMWSDAELALDWINKERNNAMHGGYHADRRAACLALFCSMKLLLVLARNRVLELELPDGMYRHSRILASWQKAAPRWVPLPTEAENIAD